MGIIIWLIVGGIVGWLASIIMKRDAQQGIILNIVVGIIGALLAGWLFGGGINEAITIRTFLFSLIGAVILLAGAFHVRRDLGVPLHLADLGAQGRSAVVLLAEVGEEVEAGMADYVWFTAAVPEQDYCAQLRQ